jgi:hypothetical protein
MHNKSVIITVLNIFLLSNVWSSSTANAQQTGTWYVDNSSSTGTIARVEISSRTTFIIVFEYARRCEPIFSMIAVRVNGRGMGSLLDQKALKSGSINLKVDGSAYTWHGALAVYQRADEFAIGVTNKLYRKLINNVRSLRFIKPNGSNYDVPTKGLSQAVITATNACITRLG